MQTFDFTPLPFLLIAFAAVLLWIVAFYSFFSMLAHLRVGWIKFLYSWGWWNPKRAHEFIEPAGMPHYHRLMKTITWFLTAVLVGILYGAVMIFLQG